MGDTKRGHIIVLEGMVGCGKTTQTDAVETYLQRQSIPYVRGREPGGVPLAEEIRKLLLADASKGMDPLTEILLFEAARAEFVRKKVKPVVDAGTIFLTDRWSRSTTAFQGYGRGYDLEKIRQYNADAAQGYDPSLVLIIDVPDPEIETAVIRAQAATKKAGTQDRFEREQYAFHQRVRDGYRASPQAYPGIDFLLDGHTEELDIPQRIRLITADVYTHLDRFFASNASSFKIHTHE